MAIELPPPPAPIAARLEASFSLPEAQVHIAEAGYRPVGPVFCEYALGNPIKLILDPLGFVRPLLLEILESVIPKPMTESDGGEIGEEAPDPAPQGDPIPVGGGGGGPTGG